MWAAMPMGVLLLLLLLLLGSAASVEAARPSRSSAADSNCTQISHVLEGPYWVEENIEAANVRLNVSYGVPLNITFKLVNSTLSEQQGTCAGIEHARIDLWQCRYDGRYSDEDRESTAGETWLRGYQFTNATGHASFYTIFPGWYRWRTVHIHVRVRVYEVDSSATTIYEDTTQLYFDDAISEAIFTNVYPYNKVGLPDTTNKKDLFFKNTNLINMTGSYLDDDGYSSLIEMSLPFYPFTFLGDISNGENMTFVKRPFASIM